MADAGGAASEPPAKPCIVAGAGTPPTPVFHVAGTDAHDRACVIDLLGQQHIVPHCWPSLGDLLQNVFDIPPGCVILGWHDAAAADGVVSDRLLALPALHASFALAPHGTAPKAIGAIRTALIDVLPTPLDPTVFWNAVDLAIALFRRRQSALPMLKAARAQIARLTPRERDVLSMLSLGASNKGVAAKLSISARTVEIHRAKMMVKLGVASLAQATRMAHEAGLY